MNNNKIDNKRVIEILSIIYNLELNGVVRYTHYSLMIYGYNRLPLVDFFRSQASESLMHAEMAGEHITGLDGHPPLNTVNIEETNKHNVRDILEESLIHEQDAIDAYYDLLNEIKDKSVYLEEYCRSMIAQEEKDYNEMKKLIKDNS